MIRWSIASSFVLLEFILSFLRLLDFLVILYFFFSKIVDLLEKIFLINLFFYLFLFLSAYLRLSLRKKSLFPRPNDNFFLNLRNHMFSSCANFLVSLSWRLSPCPEDDAPPQEGDRPRSRSQFARSSFAFFLLTSRSY